MFKRDFRGSGIATFCVENASDAMGGSREQKETLTGKVSRWCPKTREGVTVEIVRVVINELLFAYRSGINKFG